MTRILITGGTGFLGRGILRYAKRKAWDAEMIVYSRDEYKQDMCRSKYPDATYVLGDILNYERLMTATRNVDVIIHTAAIKFIPEAEFNVDECIAVNVEGTRNVLRAAYHNGVGHTIGISTDKACLPINTYGMSKALGERLFGEFSHHMFCTMARYGNVIGSTGSVIPRFQALLDEGKPIMLTDPTMTRYWIDINEACKLIDLALMSHTGSIVIPKPRAMVLQDLANALIKSAGRGEALPCGVRPGEKHHEALLHHQESIRAVDEHTHYELHRVGSDHVGEPFILSSNTPQGGWIQPDELLAAIADAKMV